MDDTETENVTKRMNDLALESTQTFIDATYLAQRQSAQLIQAWLNTLDNNQQQSRDVATRLLQQAQEAQSLLQQYVRDTVRANADALGQATQAGFTTMAQGFNQTAQQAATAGHQAAETASSAGTENSGS